MNEQQESALLDNLQEAWRDLAEALGWLHTEGCAYHKNNGVNEQLYAAAKTKFEELVKTL